MPNWVYNHMTLTGSRDDINTFMSKIQIPETKSAGPLKLVAIELTSNTDSPKDYRFFNSFVRMPEEIEHLPYDPDRYNWERDNWGVKWGDNNTQIEKISDIEIKISFDTPWSFAQKFFEQFVKICPLSFHIMWYEEQMYYGGELIKSGENIVSHSYQDDSSERPFHKFMKNNFPNMEFELLDDKLSPK